MLASIATDCETGTWCSTSATEQSEFFPLAPGSSHTFRLRLALSSEQQDGAQALDWSATVLAHTRFHGGAAPTARVEYVVNGASEDADGGPVLETATVQHAVRQQGESDEVATVEVFRECLRADEPCAEEFVVTATRLDDDMDVEVDVALDVWLTGSAFRETRPCPPEPVVATSWVSE